MKEKKGGALSDHELRELVVNGFVINADQKNISPASLDLTISEEIYVIRGLMLPRGGEKVRALLNLMGATPTALSQPLISGQIYLARLNESLSLSDNMYGYCNSKSSTGRLDIHVRVLADGVPRFDSIPARGFEGELWIAIIPHSFSIQLYIKTPLTQLRLFTADTRFSNLDLEIAMKDGLVFEYKTGKQLSCGDLITNDHDGTVVLTALVENGLCGYECIARPEQVLDISNIGGYEAKDFFKPLTIDDGALRLQRDKFYILSGAESIRLSPTIASEMIPMDERSGDFRSHYAGFLDPGWGYGKDGEGKGRPFTLEVRPFEDLVMRNGQPIAKIKFERMSDVPDIHYDVKSSNYLKQFGPKLGKQFKTT